MRKLSSAFALTISFVIVVTSVWLLFFRNSSDANGSSDTYLNINNLSAHHGAFVAAHRSGNGTLGPENSVLSISNCISKGIDIIEIDLARSRDGIYFVFHDRTLEVTTDVETKFPARPQLFVTKNNDTLLLQYPVSAFTSKEISTLNLRERTRNEGEAAASGSQGITTDLRVPTLEEILKLTKGKILIRLDKWDDNLIRGNVPKEIAELVAEQNMFDQTLFSGRQTVEDVKALFDQYYLMVSFMPYLSSQDSADFLAAWRNTSLHRIKVSGYRIKITDENDSVAFNYLRQVRGEDKKCIYIAANVPAQSANKGDNREGWMWLFKYADFVETDKPEEMIAFIKGQSLLQK